MDTNPIHELAPEESWDLLRRNEFGRLAFHLLNEVHITPINYAVDKERIIFRTAEGSKLLAITMNEDVAFEVDDYTGEKAWSVVARGQAHQLEGYDADIADQIPLRPWVPTAKFNVVAINVTEISGRRFDLSKPWEHMMHSSVPPRKPS